MWHAGAPRLGPRHPQDIRSCLQYGRGAVPHRSAKWVVLFAWAVDQQALVADAFYRCCRLTLARVALVWPRSPQALAGRAEQQADVRLACGGPRFEVSQTSVVVRARPATWVIATRRLESWIEAAWCRPARCSDRLVGPAPGAGQPAAMYGVRVCSCGPWLPRLRRAHVGMVANTGPGLDHWRLAELRRSRLMVTSRRW